MPDYPTLIPKTTTPTPETLPGGGTQLPALFSPDSATAQRVLEFFTANIRNPHTAHELIEARDDKRLRRLQKQLTKNLVERIGHYYRHLAMIFPSRNLILSSIGPQPDGTDEL